MALNRPIAVGVRSYISVGIDQAEKVMAAVAQVPATERVTNGDFSSATGWDTSGAGWTIATNQATNNTVGQPLTNSLQNAPITAGQHFEFSFNIVLNPLNTSVVVRLVNSITSATQQIYSDGTTTGVKTSSGTVSGDFDQLLVLAADDSGLAIDDVSLMV